MLLPLAMTLPKISIEENKLQDFKTFFKIKILRLALPNLEFKKIKQMKKLLLLLTITIISCSSEKTPDCKCTAKYTNVNSGQSYYIPNTPIDCETKRPIDNNQQTNDVWFVGCSNLNKLKKYE